MSVTRLSSLWSCSRSLVVRPLVWERTVCALHTSVRRLVGDKPRDRRDLTRNMPDKVEGTDGQNLLDITLSAEAKKCYRLPDENTPNELFDGIPFNQVSVCHIHTTKNNTIMVLTNPDRNKILLKRSCGTEGFKHCRKGTTVAAHATGLAMAARMVKAGFPMCRVCVKGLGPGRMEGLKGLVMGGIKVISITDTTRYYDHPCRPPAARSL